LFSVAKVQRNLFASEPFEKWICPLKGLKSIYEQVQFMKIYLFIEETG